MPLDIENVEKFKSQLPTFIAERIAVDWGRMKHALLVTCPSSDCGQQFIVKLSWKRSRPGFIGRSCPYCFKTARLPKY